MLRDQLDRLEETARAAGATPADTADLLGCIERAKASCAVELSDMRAERVARKAPVERVRFKAAV